MNHFGLSFFVELVFFIELVFLLAAALWLSARKLMFSPRLTEVERIYRQLLVEPQSIEAAYFARQRTNDSLQLWVRLKDGELHCMGDGDDALRRGQGLSRAGIYVGMP